MRTIWKVLTRKKVLDPVTTEQTQLSRVLSTIDLTALGVGSTLGVGVYVLAGQVAKETAGPAVVLSFLIAAVASMFSGLCYAEVGARAPRAGSAYIYSYVCVGEFIAFVIGWNLILEYVIGAASVARGLSLYLDNLLNKTMESTFTDVAPINAEFMANYFDFFAFGMSILMSTGLAFGLKESSLVNNIFTLLNVIVVVFVVIAGSIKANGENWALPKNCTNCSDKNVGEGGFFPFGIDGMIKGAATCFYAFVGFDCIATTGEEVRNPQKAIPLSIVLSLSIIFLAYFGTSTIITLMVPYYLQDSSAPIPHAFEAVGWDIPKWIVAIGAIFGLCASLYGAMFPLPRILYAMSSDNLIFGFLGRVNERFKTPVVGTLLAGLLIGAMAALFDLKQLVDMMSIGTLLAYSIVAASVLLLRFKSDQSESYEPSRTASNSKYTYTENRGLEGGVNETGEYTRNSDKSSSIFKQIFNFGRFSEPTTLSEKLVAVLISIYCVLCICVGLCAIYLHTSIAEGKIWAIVIASVVVFVTVLVIISITVQPRSRKKLFFKVPLVPLIPALSILINIYLMLMLDYYTWIRFAVWMALGLPTYYFSVKNHTDARNMSISSKSDINGQQNGYANHAYVHDEKNDVLTHTIKSNGGVNNKRPAPPPPSLEKIESTIAEFDDILDKEEAAINNNRKYSNESASNISSSLTEENVKADVHRADIPRTPIDVVIENPLVKSSSPAIDHPVPSVPSVDESTDNNKLPSTDELNQSINSGPDYSAQKESSSSSPTLITSETQLDNNETLPPESEMMDNNVETFSTVTPPPSPTGEAPRVLETPIPPPPPFLKSFEDDVDVNIPRPRFQATDFKNVKLKQAKHRTPKSPPVDYSRQNSELHSLGNLAFGSQEYESFREKLTEQLQQNLLPPKIIGDVNKNQNQVQKENVVEDPIDKNEAKEKLLQFIGRSPENASKIFGNNITKPIVNKFQNELNDNKNYNDVELRDKHQQNMKDVFGSIKLRKVDSMKDDDTTDNSHLVKESQEDSESPPMIAPSSKTNSKTNDELRHRENMGNIFRSIRLRKVESFKIDGNETN